MKTSSTISSALTAFYSLFLLAGGQSFAQGIIGGSQNGLGPGGYLPGQPPAVGIPAQQVQNLPVVASIGMAGYDFKLVVISGQPVKVVIDSQGPIVVPLAVSSTSAPVVPVTPPKGPGFLASFAVTNNSSFPRVFEFVDQYYANLQVMFRVFNSKDQEVWQSSPIEVDIPPFAKKVNLTLAAHSAWQKTVFVPLQHADHSLLAPGQYTLQAEVIGTPGYGASAPFRVSTLVGGPIIPINPTPLSTK